MRNVRTKKAPKAAIEYDTKVGVLEDRYGVDLDARADKTFGQYLRDVGYGSLADILQRT